ncbi:hypothetical protein BX666DRAFT_1813913, partial [Dichotomocladium elegans]
TFMEGGVLSVQSLTDKKVLISTSLLPSGEWSLIEIRSADVQRDFENCLSWKRVFEVLFKPK